MTETVESVLERAIVQVQARRLDFSSMLWAFAASELCLVSAEESAGDGLGDIRPLVLQRQGRDLLALFTVPARAAAFARSHPYLVTRGGFELLRWMPADAGLVVNPGSGIGFEMQSDGIARLRSELESV